MEILIESNQSVNGKSHHLSGMIRNHATAPSAFLGEVVELVMLDSGRGKCRLKDNKGSRDP